MLQCGPGCAMWSGMIVPAIPPNSARYLQIVEDVQARLCLICREMSTPLFNTMVERIALVQLTYEQEPLVQ
jgi:hypothetical protein